MKKVIYCKLILKYCQFNLPLLKFADIDFMCRERAYGRHSGCGLCLIIVILIKSVCPQLKVRWYART